ncbi:MAG: hypothetical protein IPK88_17835 [Saprospiraceae bacterium]|nr:hypothetical protein [Candidatus Defluviibacterium haderslevense]
MIDFFVSILEWILKASGFFGVFLIALKLGLATFFTKIIEFRIELEKDKKLEDYKIDQLIKLKADMIAELILEFNKKNGDSNRLNKLAFDASLWLPKNLVEMMTKMLIKEPNAPHYKQVLAEFRVHLLGENERISPESIAHFPDPSQNNM